MTTYDMLCTYACVGCLRALRRLFLQLGMRTRVLLVRIPIPQHTCMRDLG